MGRIVIVAYQPKPGKEDALRQLTKEHHSRLLKENLVTERIPVIMEAQNGTVIEVFEWISEEAIQQAHTNTAVLQLWQEYSEVCEYIPIGNVAEASSLFSSFMPL